MVKLLTTNFFFNLHPRICLLILERVKGWWREGGREGEGERQKEGGGERDRQTETDRH